MNEVPGQQGWFSRDGWTGRWWARAIEVLLVLAILGLLAAIWLPTILGARPGSSVQ